jgi:AraC family transcriptional regulator of adaptative response/methylated-DNA-[protein]-cysteine methyltransferase
MTATQQEINYNRIAEAISYISNNFTRQPDLDEIAEKINLSPFHFQRLFSEWAGISPKKFLQFTSAQYAKNLLKDNGSTLFDTANRTGLSGTGRLHDLFVNIEGMTPAEYKNGGKNLEINYSYGGCHFGNIVVASTCRGVCYMAFDTGGEKALQNLFRKFPNANFFERIDPIQQNALLIFQDDWTNLSHIKLHLKGTDFQLKVWESLLKIPMGKLSTYGSIAKEIDSPNSSRAIGTAIGSNPVAFLIPCHRVIQSSGIIGGYMWDPIRKRAMIGWEAARMSNSQ